MSGAPSELATSEVPESEGLSVVADTEGEADSEPQMASFPPYPPYATEPAPPTVAEAIIAGHGLRLLHKSKPRKSLRPLPKPAKPRSPKATDVKMSRPAMRAHARCLRRHGAILTDRLERISKPRRRTIIYLWRDNAHKLTPDTIARLRSMLDADEPFKPDQAYEYFVNLKKTKKKAAAIAGVRAIKKDILAMCAEKKFTWARNATVAFARGIQHRLSRPGRYALADGMLRLSDIILHDMCGYMCMKTPSRRCTNPKAKFMMEMSDKIAVWIDEILTDSDDKMLMMDFDEDDDVLLAARGGGLYNGGGGGDDWDGSPDKMAVDGPKRAARAERPAYLKFDGNMRKAFDILTDAMEAKGDENLLSVGKFDQTYVEACDELKRATDLKATEYSAAEGEKIYNKLEELTRHITPPEIAGAMTDMLELCASYLAQNAEYNKEKGPAFKFLIKELKKTPDVRMYEKGKIKMTNAQAAKELEKAKGLEADHDEPNLAQTIYSALKRIISKVTPKDLKKDMDETVDTCSKYLSQKAVDDNERGPAFDLLIKHLEKQGGKPFSDFPALKTRNAAAYVLKSAPGLESSKPDPKTADEFKVALHKAVDTDTPKAMKSDMNNVIDLCGNYLSAFIRDRGPAMELLLGMLKSTPNTVFVARNDYKMDHGTAADEVENAPYLVPYLPIKDIADEAKAYLTQGMKDVTPPELKLPVQVLIQDASKYLSQLVALRSGAAGDRYKMNFLAAVKKSLGSRPLYKYKSSKKTYADASDELQTTDSTPLDNLSPPATALSHKINSEMKRGIPTILAPTVVEDIQPTMDKAAMHLAKIGVEKGDAMDYVVHLMQDKGEEKLGKLQGYDQTYSDGARRLEQTLTLQSSTVDVAAYSAVKGKLTDMTHEKPDERFAAVLPEIIDDSANFLAAPIPKTNAEQKQVLADLMGRKGDTIIGEKDPYKLTYQEGGEVVKSSPVGVTKAHDEAKNKEMVKQIRAVIPDKRMQIALKEATKEGAAYLTDAIEGRGQALEGIETSLKKEGQKEFIDVGKFKKDHKQIGEMLHAAPNLKSDDPSPVILENVEYHFDMLPKETPPDKPLAQDHMKSMTDIAAQFIATKATEDCGLDAQELAALDAAGFNAEARAAAAGAGAAAVGAGAAAAREGAAAVGAGAAAARPGAAAAGPRAAAAGSGAAAAGPGAAAAGPGAAAATRAAAARPGAAAAGPGAAAATRAAAARPGAAAAGPGAAAAGRGAAAAGAGTAAAGPGPAAAGPGATVAWPGAASAWSGAVAAWLGAAAAWLGAAATGPGADSAEREAAAAGPGAAAAGPGAAAAGPAAVAAGPGAAAAGPGAAAAGPGAAAYGPGAAAYGPGAAAAGPGAAAAGLRAAAAGPRAAAAGPRAAAAGLGVAAAGVGAAAAGVGAAAAEVGATATGDGGPGSPGGPGGPGGALGETEEKRRRRQAEAEEYRKHGKEEEKRLAEQERLKRMSGKYKGEALGAYYDPEHEAALDILHQELRARGSEVLYKQPLTTLTHEQASDWLADPEPVKLDKSVKDSPDTTRLHMKFEKKLSEIVKDKTPPDLKDNMQDVAIEAARKTAERFVAANYKDLVNDNLVSEMQKRGNEILTDVDGAAETYFFAAQRVKRKDPEAVNEPCYKVANEIGKKLDDVIRNRPMLRKLNMTMKEHIKDSSKFLSGVVTKPDNYIEAYVALLAEMEAAGDARLIESEVPKTYKESADYLRQLTTFKDTIGYLNKPMKNKIQSKLKNLMAHAPPTGSMGSSSAMDTVIADAAGLLVSYVMLQDEKTAVLDTLVKEMQNAGEGALLRHGRLLKSFKEGAELLEGKTIEELGATNADPVVARKVQIKLTNLMNNETPAKFQALMTEIIEDATTYLAVHLLDPQVLKVCKCYKNVFVQCELWVDEIFRQVARPACTCSRHVSVQALQDLAPDFLAPGVEFTFKPCPNQARTPERASNPSRPAQYPAASYLLYDPIRFGSDSMQLDASSPSTSDSVSQSPESSLSSMSPLRTTKQFSPLKSLLLETRVDTTQSIRKQQEQLQSFETAKQNRKLEEIQAPSYFASTSSSSLETSTSQSESATCDRCQQFAPPISDETSKISKAKTGYSSRTPIISAAHTVDWVATMVSLLWNVLAWRDWIQEIIDNALAYKYIPSFATARGETATSWLSYHRRVTTEALQWRQYSVFSRQLTTRLHLQYKDKEIVSPIQSNVKTKAYIECQEAMLGMVDMFNRWTRWLNLVVKETDSLKQIPGSEMPLHEMRWNHLKLKVKEYSKDWENYNNFLKVSWEQKYTSVIADYLPSWKKRGPVWVASACGAVPSGAVAAGMCDSEVIWVARTMHRCTVLPATLLPSKHCCIVYAEGKVFRYNNYQVMCNAEVSWVARRGGSVNERAVCVAPGMYVGRVHYHGDQLLGAVHEPHYHCHIVIFGRSVAFNYYELLMFAGDDYQKA